ncbi:amino acid ABC transporter permease [Paeniglutamicibacter cryotolerans]|uniref:Polar amino acid transport system permease protein n=1 Tax=Paeniglutamicibacter cryotolerans TaxID=670079 RepID=A0A839QVR4_9MICC|nr:amino acid ABC transporter permease [Paeniglutamicibacter cryotolerans]MBB2996101.1 polar amino acid transport system permease protein [Paeniglutamicibacter cryotolerans]
MLEKETTTEPARLETPVPAKKYTVVPLRYPWRWITAALVLGGLGLVGRAFLAADINYDVVIKYLTNAGILTGVRNTLVLLLAAMAVGLVLGVLTAVMRQSPNPVLRWVGGAYVWLFRGTPLLVQLLIWFNLSIIFETFTIPGLFSIPMNTLMTPFVAALLGLGINEGAYISEIVRGGILAVDHGQREAASAIGMSRAKTMRRIVLPQAMRVIVPPLGNEFISCLKFTSLAYTISYSELLHSANKIYTANFKVIELLFTAAIWYIALTTVFSLFQQLLEDRLSRGVPGAQVGFIERLRRNLSLRRAS